MTSYAFSASDYGYFTFTSFDVRMMSYKKFLLLLDSESKNTNLSKIKPNHGKYASFFTFLFCNPFITKGCHDNT